MNEFSNQIAVRVALARSALASARAQGQDYLVTVREGELESLAHLAATHDLTIDLTGLEQREPA